MCEGRDLDLRRGIVALGRLPLHGMALGRLSLHGMALGRLPLHGGAQHATANASYNIQRTPYDLGRPRPRWALRGRPPPALVRIGQTGSRRA